MVVVVLVVVVVVVVDVVVVEVDVVVDDEVEVVVVDVLVVVLLVLVDVVVVVVVVVVVGVTLDPGSDEELPPPAEPGDELPTWPQTFTETHKAEIKVMATLNINLKSVFIFNPIQRTQP